MRSHRYVTSARGPAVASLAAVVLLSTAAGGQNPRFYPDDPIGRVPYTQDASKVQRKDLNLIYDESRNLFGNPGDPDMDRRAMSINTIDEVPDSSWFTNRILGGSPLSADGVARGPNTGDGPAPGKWMVSSKRDGVTPGFTIIDTGGTRWFIKFDPRDWPEMMSGAEVTATKLYHALGYHVPENYVTRLTRDMLVIGERSTTPAASGGERHLTELDIDRSLRTVAQESDGSYRVVASRALEGRPVGPFLYEGTRSDDPNDVVPHEHRRELRGLRVFAAWTNHVDTKAINSLDTLVSDGGRTIVRHHLIDFGSTLGSASVKPRDYDEGHQYIFDGGSAVKGIFGFGFYIPAYHFIDYPDIPSVGRFTADGFDPPAWKPRVPNPAFRRARPDDTFWAARRVLAFTDEMIRAAVRSGQYSDPAAGKYVADTLIARRDAIGRAWLTNVNPVVDPVLDASGMLRFGNAAVMAKVASAPASYEVSWFTFDNASGASTPIGSPAAAAGEQASAPAGLPTADGAYVRVEIKAVNPPHASWAIPVQAFFRREGGGWTLVGFERLP